MKKLILLIALIIACTKIKADTLVEVDALYLETEKTILTNRGYYLPEGSNPNYNLNLGFDLVDSYSGMVYSRNVVSSTTDQSQFRYVALDTEFGISTTVGLEIYLRHFSGHLMDATDPDGQRFPEENVIGVRFNLINPNGTGRRR